LFCSIYYANIDFTSRQRFCFSTSMKYKILLRILQILIYIKRFFWWLGAKIIFVFVLIFRPVWVALGFVVYKISYGIKHIAGAAGLNTQMLRRDNLQILILLILFLVAIPQTKIYAKKDLSMPGQNTIAYALTGSEESVSLEEVVSNSTGNTFNNNDASWRNGVVASSQNPEGSVYWRPQDLSGVMAGGSALSKPKLIPGVILGGTRTEVIVYVVQPGDSLSEIAAQFGVSVATVLWQNKLGLNSYIRPGDKLEILPVTGLTHTIKKGDSLAKIAKLYGTTADGIIKFNKLKPDGSDLKAGEKIVVPNGVMPQSSVASVPRTYSSFVKAATPPNSTGRASLSGFVWPTGAKTITQYFSWSHQAVDIAGPLLTPNYAAKAGVVKLAQCGWNNGYGCTIVIDHGGGVTTRYSHNAKLLVTPGEYVTAGQTVGLMGNTGNVRGRTGIHLDFRLVINGVYVNPLNYIR